ncbi:MAG TPA: DUF2914 domain-containing protein, partial [Minicystis sp.]|nr:DUF2914 domain-containing protein [Minicystis sp.]
ALHVKRLVVSTGVAGREPVGASDLFRTSETERLYAFVEIENPSRHAGDIRVTFEPPDGRAPRGNVELAVGETTRWRTWAYTTGAHQVGSWTAVVKDRSGRTLARKPFEIAL